MEVEDKNITKKEKKNKKSKKCRTSIGFYIASIIATIIGIASLVTNITLFTKTVKQYVSQGYSQTTVVSQLLPSQLLPSLFETVVVYFGIAVILFGIGLINKKLSQVFKAQQGETSNVEVISEDRSEDKENNEVN